MPIYRIDSFDQLLNCKEFQNSFQFKGRRPKREKYPEPTIEEMLSLACENNITGELLKIGANDLTNTYIDVKSKKSLAKKKKLNKWNQNVGTEYFRGYQVGFR